MVDCGDKGCKRRLEETHKAVFKDGEGGCRFDINWLKSHIIGKRVALALLITFGVPAYYSAVNIWMSGHIAEYKIETNMKTAQALQGILKEEISRQSIQDIRITRLEDQFQGITSNLNELKVQNTRESDKLLEAIKNIRK